MKIELDGEQALAAAIEKYYELPKYQYIMDNIFSVTLTNKDEEIRKYFNGYYNIRKNTNWLNNYYAVFEKKR